MKFYTYSWGYERGKDESKPSRIAAVEPSFITIGACGLDAFRLCTIQIGTRTTLDLARYPPPQACCFSFGAPWKALCRVNVRMPPLKRMSVVFAGESVLKIFPNFLASPNRHYENAAVAFGMSPRDVGQPVDKSRRTWWHGRVLESTIRANHDAVEFCRPYDSLLNCWKRYDFCARLTPQVASSPPSGFPRVGPQDSNSSTGLASLPPLDPSVASHRMTVSTVPARVTEEVFSLYVKYQVRWDSCAALLNLFQTLIPRDSPRLCSDVWAKSPAAVISPLGEGQSESMPTPGA